MGERALAVVLHEQTAYWYRSQWGATENALASVFNSPRPVDELLSLDWRFLASCSLSIGLDAIDSLTTEALFLVTSREVDVFCPLWFGLGLTERVVYPSRGILIPTQTFENFRRCRSAHRQFKELLLEYVMEATIPSEMATTLLSRMFDVVSSFPCSISLDGEYL